MQTRLLPALRCLCLVVLTAVSSCGDDGSGGKVETPDPALQPVACEGGSLEAVVHTAPPGQGPASLGEGDSDGNGILDRDEWGSDAVVPDDTDGDARADYEDPDDDGDGLLDVYDPERLAKLEPTDLLSLDDRLHLHSAHVEIGEHRLVSVARPGDTLVIQGENLGCDSIVMFDGSGGPIDVLPKAAGAGELHVVVPESARDQVAIAAAGRRSNPLSISIVSIDAPVLFEPSPRAGRGGSVLRLAGANLAGVDTVWFGTSQVAPDRAASDWVEVRLPAEAPASRVIAKAGSRASNAVFFRVLRLLTVSVPDVASGRFAAAELSIFQPWSDDVAPDAVGGAQIDVGSNRYDVVRTSITRGDRSAALFEAVYLPGDAALAIDAESTAVSLVLGTANALPRVLAGSRRAVRELARGLDEVSALGAAISSALDADVFVREADELPFATALASALSAFEQALEQAVVTGSVALVDSAVAAELGPSGALVPNRSEPWGGSDFGNRRGTPPTQWLSAEDPGEVTITPPQYSIEVTSPPGTGNVTVRNGRALYLSAQIVDRETGATLSEHAWNPYSPKIIGPQGLDFGLFEGWLWSYAVDFDQPRFRDARVEVVTPALVARSESNAAFWLLLRTLLDQIAYPIVEFVVGEVIDPAVWIKVVMNHAPDLVAEMYALVKTPGPLSVDVVFNTFVNGVVRELKSGEALPALARAVLGEKAALEAGASMAKRLAHLVIPGAGTAKVALTLLDATTKATTIVRTVADLASVEGQLDFDVTFGMGITKVVPATVKQSCNGVVVDVHGAGFRPKTVAGVKHYPEVTLSDPNPGGAPAETFKTPEYQVNATGTVLTFTTSEGFSASAVGPLDLLVVRGDEQAQRNAVVEFTDRLALSTVQPSAVQPGDPIVLNGSGYDLPGPFTVIFEEKNPPVGLAKSVSVSSFSSITANAIALVVPTLPSNEQDWWVWVQRGDPACPLRSEKRDVTTASGECIVDLHALGGSLGISSQAHAVNQSGDVIWTHSGSGTFLRHAGVPTKLPCGARALNDMGQTAGLIYFFDSSTGACTPLADLYAQPAIAWGINDAGIAVGALGSGNAGAAYWPTPETLVQLPSLRADGKGFSEVRDINEAGQIVGSAVADGGDIHAVRWVGGIPQKLGTPPSAGSRAYAINEAGVVVGAVDFYSSVSHAYVWQQGGAIDIGVFEFGATGPEMVAHSINEANEVVGTYVGDSVRRAFIWLPVPSYAATQPGLYELSSFISDPTWTIEAADSINDSGQIAATGRHGGKLKAALIDLPHCKPAQAPVPH